MKVQRQISAWLRRLNLTPAAETRSCYVAQAELELEIFLSQLPCTSWYPKYYDYRSRLPFLADWTWCLWWGGLHARTDHEPEKAHVSQEWRGEAEELRRGGTR